MIQVQRFASLLKQLQVVIKIDTKFVSILIHSSVDNTQCGCGSDNQHNNIKIDCNLFLSFLSLEILHNITVFEA